MLQSIRCRHNLVPRLVVFEKRMKTSRALYYVREKRIVLMSEPKCFLSYGEVVRVVAVPVTVKLAARNFAWPTAQMPPSFACARTVLVRPVLSLVECGDFPVGVYPIPHTIPRSDLNLAEHDLWCVERPVVHEGDVSTGAMCCYGISIAAMSYFSKNRFLVVASVELFRQVNEAMLQVSHFVQLLFRHVPYHVLSKAASRSFLVAVPPASGLKELLSVANC